MDVNIIRDLVLLIIPYLLLSIAFFLNSKDISAWVIRKFIHSSGLFVAGLYGSFIDNFIQLIFILIVLIVSASILSFPPIYVLPKLVKMATRKGESEMMVFLNGSLTLLGVVILRFIFVQDRWIFLAAVLCVAWGDALGEFIGKPFGTHKYKIFSQKSIEGSLGVLFGSIVGGIFSMLLFQITGLQIIMTILFASIIVTIIEAISILFIDNLLMQFIYTLVMWYFLIY